MAGFRTAKKVRPGKIRFAAIMMSHGKAPLCETESGFTLLELMVSIAILGLGVVMAIQLFSGGLSLAKTSDDYTGKVLIAKEKMTEMLSTEKISEGKAAGITDDGVMWAVEIDPYDEKRADDGEAANVFKIVVSIDGPGAGKNTFTLTTLKRVF